MLIDRYDREDVFTRVPELADQTDPVLVELDRLLDDEALYAQVRGDLARRYRLTLVHGRRSTPVEVLLRLLVVQHLYAWSYEETVERVADSLVLRWCCAGAALVLRWCCRVYFRRVPTKATRLRWAATIRPATVQALVDRTTLLATQAKVTRARKLRLDSTCVQTSIHHPTDSGLLGDGVRVLGRLIQRARPLVPASLATVRDAFRSRLCTSRRLVQRIHRVSRLQGAEAEDQQRALYRHLLEVTRQTVRQARRVRTALQPLQPLQPLQTLQAGVTAPPDRVRRLTARLAARFDRFLPVVEQTIHQAQRRVLDEQPVVTGGVTREGAEPVRAPHARGAAGLRGQGQGRGRVRALGASSTRSRGASSRASTCSPMTNPSATRRCRPLSITGR